MGSTATLAAGVLLIVVFSGRPVVDADCGCPGECEHDNYGSCIATMPCPSQECMTPHGIPIVPCSVDGGDCYCVAGSTFCDGASGPSVDGDPCPLDVKDCPDGNVVSRDPSIGCDFPECPQSGTPECGCPGECDHDNDGSCIAPMPCPSQECMTPHGIPIVPCSVDGGDCYCVAGSTFCDGASGPSVDGDPCPLDVKDCPDGNVVSRDPSIGCDFPECPQSGTPECGCPGECEHDNDGSCIAPMPCPSQECMTPHGIPIVPCSAEGGECYCVAGSTFCDAPSVDGDPCPLDVKDCPDGSVVSRDPSIGCDFPECPQSGTPECGCPGECEHDNDGSCIAPVPCPSQECMTPHGIPIVPCSADGGDCYCVAGSTFCGSPVVLPSDAKGGSAASATEEAMPLETSEADRRSCHYSRFVLTCALILAGRI